MAEKKEQNEPTASELGRQTREALLARRTKLVEQIKSLQPLETESGDIKGENKRPPLEEIDLCGICGQPGADKIPHTHYWPTEKRPETEYVHAECEGEECARAYMEYRQQVGEEGIQKFLRDIK